MRSATIIRAALLAALLAGSAGTAMAQEAGAPDAAVSIAPEAPIAPWYQEFTQNEDRFDLSGYAIDQSGPSVEWDVDENWGVSLGFRSGSNASNEDLNGVSAGAYFKLSPRLRVGGELGYRSGQDNLAGLRTPETASPQIKLESAFRF